jgi:hypothetical protein
MSKQVSLTSKLSHTLSSSLKSDRITTKKGTVSPQKKIMAREMQLSKCNSQDAFTHQSTRLKAKIWRHQD